MVINALAASSEAARRLRDFAWTDAADVAERRRSFGAVAMAALALGAGGTIVAARRERMEP